MYVRLRQIRKRKGYSAKKMATALGLQTEAAYYKKETGLIRFSLEEARIVSELLDEPMETLFFADVAINETDREQSGGSVCSA